MKNRKRLFTILLIVGLISMLVSPFLFTEFYIETLLISFVVLVLPIIPAAIPFKKRVVNIVLLSISLCWIILMIIIGIVDIRDATTISYLISLIFVVVMIVFLRIKKEAPMEKTLAIKQEKEQTALKKKEEKEILGKEEARTIQVEPVVEQPEVVVENNEGIPTGRIVLENKENAERLSAFALFVLGYKKAFKYLFKSKQIIKYLVYLFTILMGSIVGLLSPHMSVSQYTVTRKVLNEEKVDYLDSFKGINSINRYGRYFIMSLLSVIFILAPVIVTLLPGLVLYVLTLGLGEFSLVFIFAFSLAALYVLIVKTLDYYAVAYLYHKHDTESAYYLEGSERLMKGKKGRLILVSLLHGLVSIVPMFFIFLIIMALEEGLFIVIGVLVLVLIIIVPPMILASNVSLYKLLDE